MGAARLEVGIGDVSFLAEGTEEWVSSTFNQFLERTAMRRHNHEPAAKSSSDGQTIPEQAASGSAAPGNLASFIRSTDANGTQVKRFLATAVWMQRNGVSPLKAPDVAKALLDARQQPLKNPADVLNQNITKGFCVKSGEGFYVTPEGEESLSQ